MEKSLQYEPLPEFSIESTKRIMESGSIEEKIRLPLSNGMDCPNWITAQDLCISLAQNEDERISSNAVLGLAYIARIHKKLEKHLVKPILVNSLRGHKEYNWRIQDSIDDINQFMGWNIGIKKNKDAS